MTTPEKPDLVPHTQVVVDEHLRHLAEGINNVEIPIRRKHVQTALDYINVLVARVRELEAELRGYTKNQKNLKRISALEAENDKVHAKTWDQKVVIERLEAELAEVRKVNDRMEQAAADLLTEKQSEIARLRAALKAKDEALDKGQTLIGCIACTITVEDDLESDEDDLIESHESDCWWIAARKAGNE